MNKKPVAKKSDILAGTTKAVKIDGVEVMLCNAEGAIYAIEDVCTHDGGELDQGVLDGCQIECPRHGARFDVRTGAALTPPAILPVPTYRVRTEGDDIYVDLAAPAGDSFDTHPAG
jgi:3-phenylpropionate/trans-cinnamate dioxygenase ferredoxin subunit